MKTFNFLLMGLVALMISACSFSQDEGTRKENEDRIELLRKFDEVKGLYRGNISNNGVDLPVEIFIFYREIQDGGFNDKGEPTVRPVLKAKYTRLNTTLPDVYLEARYIQETAQVIMTNGTTQNTGTLTISTTIYGSQMTGTVTTAAGILGNLNATLVDKNAMAPVEGDQNAALERQRQIYRSLQGMYSGKVNPPPAQAQAFEITLDLQAVEDAVIVDGKPTGSYLPALIGTYNYGPDTGHETDLNIKTSYNSETLPPMLNVVSTTLVRGNGQPTGLRIGLSLYIKGNILEGTYTNNVLGLSGPVTLKKR